MANNKYIAQGAPTGYTLYLVVKRLADSYLLNDADGAFANAPGDPYVAMSEHATLKGLYEKVEARSAWNNGDYVVTVYHQVGGSPVPASDSVVGVGQMGIYLDAEVTMGSLGISSASEWDALLSGYSAAGSFGEFCNHVKEQYGIPP